MIFKRNRTFHKPENPATFGKTDPPSRKNFGKNAEIHFRAQMFCFSLDLDDRGVGDHAPDTLDDTLVVTNDGVQTEGGGAQPFFK